MTNHIHIQQKAQELFQEAVDNYLGIGKEKNLVLTKQLLIKAAEYGYTKAINLLADLYMRRELFCENNEEAVNLYEQGWRLGDVRSLYHLAICYAKGKGVKKNMPKAISLLKQAYEAGSPDACFDLAKYYRKKTGNHAEEALEWYKKGAEMGDAACACNLGFCYYKGEGVEKDIDKAREIFLKYAYHSPTIQKNIGIIFYQGTITTPRNIKEAIYWLEQAANNGDASAMMDLGKVYKEQGDCDKSLSWYKKSAEIDKKNGAYKYGFFLYKYNNRDESFKWMKCAAENKHIPATFMLGLFYQCGIGVPVDHTKAFYWYNIAAENDYEQAYSHIGRYYRDGRIVTQDYEKALFWFEKGINSQDDNVRSEALYDYGIMFLEGFGVRKDENKAISYLMESKGLGCRNAERRLNELNNPELVCKFIGRSSVIKKGDIVQFVQMKIEDSPNYHNWKPNILEKLNLYIACAKDCKLVVEGEKGKPSWTLGNIDYAQWVIWVSDDLHLYTCNENKVRSYYPRYFANLFTNKKKQKFKPIDLRHNLSKLNNTKGKDGEKNYEKIAKAIKKARKEIAQKGL